MAESNESDDILNKIKKEQLDDIMLDQAYNNAWLILSEQTTFEDLIERKFKTGRELIMCFDPDKGPTQNELENMIEYYVEVEEYEKCAKLRNISLRIYPEINK
tara:strand:- start:278 stop:586 length:309 start_codon:yes stop_codon:yes gene_type:complete